MNSDHQNTKSIEQLFADRQAHFARKNIHGADAYFALADDPLLPVNFDVEDIAAISLLSPKTYKTWRSTGGGPASLRLSHTKIVYPRREFCLWMAERFRQSMSA